MSDGRVEFEITADGRKAYASIDQVTAALEKSGKKWESDAKASTDKIGNSFESMLKKVAAAFSAAAIGKALINFGKEAIQAASDLREVQNVVDTTFGEKGAAEIESWSKKAGTQFGLTETQAKRFTSTLGAMMKSAGLTGNQIVGMSTDMAGLAADMASFYNLDFDTAFQKIRAGISGETEPLKQLGINMSVANLNAFALQKGLQKTFEQMSQSEQVMLRYEYLMQATSDAQGDFARTSDGFANATRMLETNLETLKTKLGEILILPLNDFLGTINGIVSALTTDTDRTVLDEFADIDRNTAQKLEEIKKTAEEARVLSSLLNKIDQHAESTKDNLNGVSVDVPTSATQNARKLSDQLEYASRESEKIQQKIDEVKNTDFDGSKLQKSSKAVIEDFPNIKKDIDKARDSSFTGSMVQQTGEDFVDSFGKIGSNIQAGMEAPISESPVAKTIKDLSAKSEAIGKSLETAKENLGSIGTEEVENSVGKVTEAVGDAAEETEDAANASEEWLEVCKRLVQTIPGLSTIIDTQTGEIKGGKEAVDAYINSWEKLEKYRTLMNANEQKRTALDTKFSELPGLEIDMRVAEKHVRDTLADVKKVYEKYKLDPEVIRKAMGLSADEDIYKYGFIKGSAISSQLGITNEMADEINGVATAYANATEERRTATKVYNEQKQAYDEAAAALEEADKVLNSEMDDETKAALVTEKLTAVKDQLTSAFESAKAAVDDYRKNALDKTTESVNKMISGFKKIEMPSLADQIKPDEMKSILDDQLKFMQDYRKNLDEARAKGLDEKLLAELSDGSKESAEYLKTIAENPSWIEKINESYRAVQGEKQKFAESLSESTLAADDEYKQLKSAADEAEANLKTVSDEIAKVLGPDLAQQIKNNLGIVQDAMDSLNKVLSSVNVPTITIPFLNTSGKEGTDGSFATGLNYVPFDGFLAQLHEGEGILTAEENRIWQSFKNGQRGVDYDTLGGVMRDSIKPGGNVYLDGRVVGSVISEMQGNQYRSLQRSGWQQ